VGSQLLDETRPIVTRCMTLYIARRENWRSVPGAGSHRVGAPGWCRWRSARETAILAMDLRDTLATNLRRLRNEKGLAQDDLAYEAKVSRSYLSQLEKGAFYASLKIL
jgi:DNA-binding XRE family transcriptional regulator